jgi:RNA polymerase sigma-70 factor (ECF subfamily)
MRSEMPHATVPGDLDLVDKARAGDYDAFGELVRRFQDRVFRLARGMTANDAEAEEVMQDTFLNVFRNLHSYRGDSAVANWILRVAANAALMRLRRQRRKPLLSLEDARPDFSEDGASFITPPGDWAKQPDEKLISRELRERIDAAIADLPEKYRLVFLLRDVEGLSADEVADALGVTVPTVKSRLHRSRLFVRDALDDYFRHRQ